MKKSPQIAEMNLLFTYIGDYGDILAATGSTDGSGNYVFPISPQAVDPSGAKASLYWKMADGFDTMYTIWNPTNLPQELTVVLRYGKSGEKFTLPVRLNEYASITIDIGELVRTQLSDQEGNIVPQNAREGRLEVSPATAKPQDLATFVLAGGIYNPSKATCGLICEACSGVAYWGVDPSELLIPKSQSSQAQFYYGLDNGVESYPTSTTNWSSNNPQVATVQTVGDSHPGLVTGAGAGSTLVLARYNQNLPLYVPQPICSSPPQPLPPCPTQNNWPAQTLANVYGVTITTADIIANQIVINLSGPSGTSGQLQVTVTGPGATQPISTGPNPQGPGTYTYDFGLGSIPIGEYTTITAVWTVNGTQLSGQVSEHFKVLGTYRLTQYNTPGESRCSGGPQSITVWDNSCNGTNTTVISGFDFRVTDPTAGTGSGHSINWGDVYQEFTCSVGSGDLRSNQTIKGTLGWLSNSTVAACPTSELYATGTQVYIVGQGIKTVTDRCPGCCQDFTHLDNYTTDTRCSGVPSLPNALTIKLF